MNATATPSTSSTLAAKKKTTAPRRARAVRCSEEELDRRLDEQRAPARGYILGHPGRFFTAEQVARALGQPEAQIDEALSDAMNEGELDATIKRGIWRFAAPGAPTFGRRRGDLERVLGARDPAGLALARHAYQESVRRGLVDRAYLFEEWLLDAVYERAAGVVEVLLGCSAKPISKRPEHINDGAGTPRGYYFGGV